MKSIVLVFSLFLFSFAYAAGWNTTDPAVQAWFQEAPVKKCCSLSDGFEADDFDATQGGVWAIITEEGDPPCWKAYDDESDFLVDTCRRPVPETKRYYVTQEKIIYMPPNPTGHGVLFLDSRDQVLCYFLPSGV